MSAPPALAPELLEAIIEAFHPSSPDGRAALIACSCASRDLTAICQKRLFRDIEVVVKIAFEQMVVYFAEDRDTTTLKFLNALVHSPHLANYVKSLTVTFRMQNPIPPAANFGNALSSNTSFSLYGIVAQLTELKKFVINAPKLFLPWWMLECQVQALFVDLVQRLEDVDLSPFFGIPTSIFRECAGLKKLHISSLSASTVNASSLTPKIRLDHLELTHLTMEGVPGPVDPFEWFKSASCPLDISRLIHLQLCTPRLPALSRMVSLCADNLQVLDLSLVGQGFGKTVFIYGIDLANHNQDPPLDLSVLRNLKNLTIGASIDHGMLNQPGAPLEVYVTDILYVASLLRTLVGRKNSTSLNTALIVQIRDVHETYLERIAWLKLMSELVHELQQQSQLVPLQLKIWTFRNGRKTDCNSHLSRIWEAGYLYDIQQAGLVEVMF